MKYTILMFFVFYSITCFSQDEEAGLITDRPDQTESAAVVPLHSVQIETGFMMSQTADFQTKTTAFAYNSTLIRYGLAKNLEFRLGMEFLGEKISVETETKESGFSPLQLGAKFKIFEEKALRPDLAVLSGIYLPFTANESFKPDYLESFLSMAFAHTLSDNLSLGYNFGAFWNGTSLTPDWIYSVSLGISLTQRLAIFLESYGTFPKVGENIHQLDTGFTFLLFPNLQFDTSGGVGIYNGVDYFVSVGMSWRIPS